MERDGKSAFTDLTERAFLIQVETDIVRTLTSADQLVIPAEGVLAAYKRDFGTCRCASRAKDYNSFRRTQRVRNAEDKRTFLTVLVIRSAD